MKKKYTNIILLLCAVSSASAHSDAFEPKFVDSLVSPYLEIQQALAGDDLSSAKDGARHYLSAMKEAPHEGSAHAETMKLTSPAKVISEADSIDNARMSFLVLSAEMSSLVRHIGTQAETPLYIVHCPMAFGNKGGSWIQNDKQVANPYYGSMMFSCGSVQKQIAGSEGHADHGKMPMKKDDHSGHSH